MRKILFIIKISFYKKKNFVCKYHRHTVGIRKFIVTDRLEHQLQKGGEKINLNFP